MQFDREKLKDTVLYICSHCEPSQLGAVKLHKVLYYSDMIQFLAVGSPLTGATYRKRPHGPTCDALLPVLRELTGANALEIGEADYFGYKKKEFRALTKPAMERFSESEILILDEMIDFVCRNNTAKTISEFSHAVPWEIVDFGEELRYHNALHLIPSQVSKETFDWAEQQAADIEAERSQSDPMDYPAFSTLRALVS